MSANTDTREVEIVIKAGAAQATMKELAAVIAVLSANLRNCKEGTKEWTDAAEKLAPFTAKMADLRAKAKEASDAFREAADNTSSFGDMLKAVLGGDLIMRGVDMIKEFGKECFQAFFKSEQSAHDLAFALKNITGTGPESVRELLDQAKELQKNGIFPHTDIEESQKLQAQFGLTTDQIKKLTPMIANFAAAMKLDMGAATKEVLLAIGGGTSPATKALKDIGIVFKGTGSEVKNLAILTEGLTKVNGENAAQLETSAGKAKKYANTWEDVKEKLGKLFDKTGIVAGIGGLVDGLDKLTEPTKTATEAFNKQNDVVKDLEKNTSPLIDRYDELKGKTTLTKSENEELNTIIEKLSQSIPSAVTEWDKYGKALDINSTSAKNFIAEQKNILSVKNKDAITEQKDAIVALGKDVDFTLKTINSGYKIIYEQQYVAGTGMVDQAKQVKLSSEEILELSTKLKGLQDELSGRKGILAELTGDETDAQKAAKAAQAVVDVTKLTIEQLQAMNTMESRDELKRRETAAKDEQKYSDKLLKIHEKLVKDLKKLDEESYLKGLDKNKKELAVVDEKYKDILDNAKAYYAQEMALLKKEGKSTVALKKEEKETLMKINWDYATEYTELQQTQAEKELDAAKKKKARLEELEKKALKEKYDAEDQAYLDSLHGMQKEEVATMQHYERLQAKAGDDAEEKKKLDEELTAALLVIWKKYHDKTISENTKVMKEMEKSWKDFAKEILKIYDDYDKQQKMKSDAALKRNDDGLSTEIAHYDQMLAKKEISQKVHDEKIASLQKQHDALDKKLKHEEFERERRANEAKAAIAGAQASAQIWAGSGTWYTKLAEQVLVAGEVAYDESIIVGEVNPYAAGGFTDGDRIYRAGEAGREWITPNWMVEHPATAPIIQHLETIRQNKNVSVSGGASAVSGNTATATPSGGTGGGNNELHSLLKKLHKVLDDGIEARLNYDLYIKDLKAVDNAKNYARKE